MERKKVGWRFISLFGYLIHSLIIHVHVFIYMYTNTCKHTYTYTLDQVVSPKETSKGTASGTILLIKKRR